MTTIVVDTNVLVSAFTDRNATQRQQAETLFRSAAAGEIAIIIPQVVVFELAFVLLNVYDQKPAAVHDLIGALIEMPGVEVRHDIDVSVLLAYWPERIPEVVDAAVAVIAADTGSRVATFDRHFATRLGRASVDVAKL